MASDFNLASSASAVMKDLYTDQAVGDLIYRDNVFFAKVAKRTDFAGDIMPQPVNYGTGGGYTPGDFTSASNNRRAPSPVKFLLSRKRGYSVVEIDCETLEAAATKPGAFVDAIQFVTDAKIQEAANAISNGLYRTGDAVMGAISSITTGVITLATADDALMFEPGQVIEAATSKSGAPRAALGYVLSVNPDAGTVTVSDSDGGSAASPSLWAGSDYLRIAGSQEAGINGLLDWLPLSAPTTGDNFLGVDRSVNPVALSGVRPDVSGLTVDKALVKAIVTLGKFGGRPDVAFMDYGSFGDLLNALGSQVRYTDFKVGNVGFDGIKIHGGSTSIEVFADRSCPAKTCFVLDSTSWKFRSLNKAPRILDNDGMTWLRHPDKDSLVARIGWRGNLGCERPGHNAVMQFS